MGLQQLGLFALQTVVGAKSGQGNDGEGFLGSDGVTEIFHNRYPA